MEDNIRHTKTFEALVNLASFFSTHPLARNARASAWARFLLWQLRSRIQQEVIVPWVAGQRLAVSRGMTGATGNIYVGLHEFDDMMLLLHFLSEGDLFVDIGANIGSYTVLASGVRKATTWAFEPAPETIRALKRNVGLNDLGGRVVIHEAALGETDGTLLFTCGLDTVNRVAMTGDVSVQIVPVKRLDNIIGQHRPVMVKMDVEGYEEQVVRGAHQVLARDSLKIIILETLTHEIETAFDHYGFERAYYDPFHRELTRTERHEDSRNALFVRDWHFVAARLAAAPLVEVLGKAL